MNYSEEQQGAIDAVLNWLHEGAADGVFRLFGVAGTGKTTLAKEIANRVEGKVIFAAFTGKAALVLNSKGCYGARTIHSLIYTPREKCAEALTALREKIELEKDDDRRRELQDEFNLERENLKRPAFNLNSSSDLSGSSLLILDEVSMVDQFIAQDLMSFDCPILALGDPAQLPPVKGTGYFIKAEPDYMLTEIHRQAAESPILALATKIRMGEWVPYEPDGDARVVPKGRIKAPELASGFDQVICGTNRTRRIVNNHIRRELGFEGPLPVIGDRIICLRNDQDSGLLNGSQWDVNGVISSPCDEDKLILSIAAAGDETAYTFDVIAHRQFFLGTEDEIAHYDMRTAQSFEFAYCITAHKSQGSAWPRVCVIDESRIFEPNAAKHLYTSVTRASEHVTVIR